MPGAILGTSDINEIFDSFTRPSALTPLEKEWKDKIDKIELEIFSNRMGTIVYEGKEVMVMVGVTPGMTGTDLNCAIYNSGGDMAMSAMGVYAHGVSGQGPIKYFLRNFKDSVGVKDGDLFYVSDPFLGGTHVNDQFLLAPIFAGDELICFVASGCHQADIGAAEVGVASSNKNRFEDGMNLTTIKIGENLKIRDDLQYALANMTRDPGSWVLDLKARYSAIVRMREELMEVISEKGAGFVAGGLRRLIEDAAEAAKKRISKYNDGTYRAVIFDDTIGRKPALVRVMLTLHKKGDRITCDFTGSSPQVHGAVNCYASGVAMMGISVLLQYLFHDLPPSQGLIHPFEFILPPHSVVNADLQSSVSASILTLFNEAVLYNIAFSKMVFDSDDRDKVCASQPWAMDVAQFVIVNQRGLVNSGFNAEMNARGTGGRTDGDGVDTQNPIWAVMADSLEAEWYEKDYPYFYLFRKHADDGGGYGKFRGGTGCQSAWLIRDAGEGLVNIIGAAHKITDAQGIFGGYGGCPSPGVFIWKSNAKELIAKGEMMPKSVREVVKEKKIKGDYYLTFKNLPLRHLGEDDVICSFFSSAGGYGDVLERDPDKVMEDLIEKIISEWTAKNVYKVVFEPETFAVDYEKTDELRKTEREDRKKRGKKYEDFEKEWLKLKPKDEIIEHFGPWPF